MQRSIVGFHQDDEGDWVAEARTAGPFNADTLPLVVEFFTAPAD